MKTPLFSEHNKLGARIVDFHGWEMPIWYSGIKSEHMATRQHCGIFDVSHMGEIYVRGTNSAALLNHVLTINVSPMQRGRVRYTFLLNENGGIIDDLTVYCIKPEEEYLLCVNASNAETDFAWIDSHNQIKADIENASDNVALLALQGPDSARILMQCLDFELDQIKYFNFRLVSSQAFGELLISKTGYTGAGGVEIFLDQRFANLVWQKFIAADATPCGLGARDTLRLEMGYPLHGNDINESTTPLEANLSFAVDLKKEAFIGKKSLEKQRQDGIARQLTGLVLLDKGVPRQGCSCLKNDQDVGYITSGSISPVLGKGIALCYLDRSIAENDKIAIKVRDKHLMAQVTRPPFVKGNVKK